MKKCLLSAFILLASLPSFMAAADSTEPITDPAHEARIAWFRQAKFGLFIHWGLYSIPAGVWEGKHVPGLGEWIMHNAPIPVKTYEQFPKQFNPVKFDAEAWVQMAEDAGMKYIVITSKHHDGFAMFHSKVSPYNIYDATPFHRDPLKELAAACARHGIRFGFYYSQSQDWHEPNGAGNTNDFGPDEKKDFDQYLNDKAEPQVKELLSNYGPVCLMWFDTPYMMTEDRGRRFMNIVRTMQPNCLIDGRLSHDVPGDYMSTGDNVIPNTKTKSDFEVPATVNNTWGFRTDDTDWKSPGEIAFKLVDITSKGGNYLLNVGPMSNGVVPLECQANLRSVGAWLKVNGEAVYGAGPSPFGPEFGEYSADLKTPQGSAVFLSQTDWRCTTKPGKLYFTLFRKSIPRDAFVLPSFSSSVKKAYFLNDPDHTALAISKADGATSIKMPRNPPDPMATVICVEIGDEQVRM